MKLSPKLQMDKLDIAHNISSANKLIAWMRAKHRFYLGYGGGEAHMAEAPEKPQQPQQQQQQQPADWWQQPWLQDDSAWYPVPAPTDAEIAAVSDQEFLVLARTSGFQRPNR